MRIQNLKAPHETAAAPGPAVAAVASAGLTGAAVGVAVANDARMAVPAVAAQPDGPAIDRQAAEIAFLKARVQHLELVIETARALMGANQERLLRRLHELPRELIELSAQLRRIDPNAAC